MSMEALLVLVMSWWRRQRLRMKDKMSWWLTSLVMWWAVAASAALESQASSNELSQSRNPQRKRTHKPKRATSPHLQPLVWHVCCNRQVSKHRPALVRVLLVNQWYRQQVTGSVICSGTVLRKPVCMPSQQISDDDCNLIDRRIDMIQEKASVREGDDLTDKSNLEV